MNEELGEKIMKDIKTKKIDSKLPQMSIIKNITSFIKYNRRLLHLDLSATGLSEPLLWCIGTSLRKSKSLISLHLSNNPGITKKLKDFL